MSRILFENSKFALGFAAVTIVGAGLLMGTDNSLSGVEVEGESEPAPSEQVAASTQQTAPSSSLPPQPVIADWASDEELIDKAEGFDPNSDDTAEIVDSPAPSAEGGSSSPAARVPGSSSQPAPNVANRSGPVPSAPKAAARNRSLDVK